MLTNQDIKTFTVKGITLNLPTSILNERMEAVFDSGNYEHTEARQIPRFLREGDRVMEFGGGVGFISAIASKACRLAQCVVIEANPQLIPVIRETHRANGIEAEVIEAVALSEGAAGWTDVTEDNRIPFYITRNFWGSSLKNSSFAVSVTYVDVVETQRLIDEYRPTVLIADIEGGELDVFEGVDLAGVRCAYFEVHKNSIGLSGINRLTRSLADQGLYYDPDFSTGAIVMYAREGA